MELDRRAQIAPWRAARSASNGINGSCTTAWRFQPHIVEAVLGHISGHKGGVSGVYNKAAYRTEKAAALALWAEHLTALVGDRPSKIVALRA